jgi:hypothetical protein
METAETHPLPKGIDLCTYNETAAPPTKASSSLGERSALPEYR